MTQRSEDDVRNMVREQYGKVAEIGASAGCAPSCCSVPNAAASLALGYSSEELASLPEGADMGLGCGNPQAIAALKAGETVLDLGSGGGFDCFLAAKQVGISGKMLEQAETVMKKAIPAVVSMVQSGKMTSNEAARIARLRIMRDPMPQKEIGAHQGIGARRLVHSFEQRGQYAAPLVTG